MHALRQIAPKRPIAAVTILEQPVIGGDVVACAPWAIAPSCV
jgi:hypothetical protein